MHESILPFVLPPTCIAHTIARLLCKIRPPPPTPPLLGHTLYTIGNGNLVSKRNRSHTQTHDKNNTTNDHTKNYPPHLTTIEGGAATNPYLEVSAAGLTLAILCSADGSTHTESNKLYRKVKHRARPNLSSRQRPKRAPTRRRSRRRQRREEPHTEHGLGVRSTHLTQRHR